MSILFINASPNKDGNTAKLAKELLAGRDYETLNLIDYKIYAYRRAFICRTISKCFLTYKRVFKTDLPLISA